MVEEACTKLPQWETDEFRSGCSCLLRDHQPPPKFNITPAEQRVIKELRENQAKVVLTADRGVVMVGMVKQDYTDKALNLLSDTNTYGTINLDPTIRLRNQLINTLKDIKQTGGLNDSTYKKVYPTSTVPPKVYGLPKIHKSGTPLDQ